MNPKGNIVFLGMMGSGKTSVGKLVSNKLKVNFFDTDHQIEKRLKMNIPNIFINKGEKFFRKQEEKITLEILNKKNIVIALGGGAFLNKIIREEVLKNHLSFWLNWDDKIIINRIEKSYKRPLAFNLSKTELINLIKKRSTVYSKALYKIDCDNLSKAALVKKILNIYETY
jgi:shikimate kinase/shikimate kinase/3-dehydroquinate synthase